jgi:hypothetical protein
MLSGVQSKEGETMTEQKPKLSFVLRWNNGDDGWGQRMQLYGRCLQLLDRDWYALKKVPFEISQDFKITVERIPKLPTKKVKRK